MIRAEGISRFYGRFEALSHVSFSASTGEVLGILGQNGAGKSTLMNILAGCLTPSAGTVQINQYPLDKQPAQARRSLGYLPEVPPVYPELTVMEYLRFCCRIKGVLQADERRHLDEIIGLTGLFEMRQRLIGSLSKGFRQRAGLAQALCGNPEVLLLDEPTAGFDPAQAVAFRKLIRELAKDKTILFSSHLLSEVQEICDRVLVIHQGRLIIDHNNREPEQTPRFRLLVQAAPARVLSPIRQLQSVRRARLEGEPRPGQALLTIETAPDSPFAVQLFNLLSGLGAPILELSPLSDTLEALFLRATGADWSAAS